MTTQIRSIASTWTVGQYEKQVASGRIIDLRNPRAEDITLDDIAHHLSLICRFNGATREFYSVAQHSILVSRLVPREYALWGLLHDAAEAYTGDVSTPLKRLVPQHKLAEANVMRVIQRVFGLGDDPQPPQCVRLADATALAWEARSFLPYHEWHDHIEGADYAGIAFEPTIRGMSPTDARRWFWERFAEIVRDGGQVLNA